MLGSAIRKITGTVGDLRGRLEMRQLSQERPRIVSTIHQVNERHLTYLGFACNGETYGSYFLVICKRLLLAKIYVFRSLLLKYSSIALVQPLQ